MPIEKLVEKFQEAADHGRRLYLEASEFLDIYDFYVETRQEFRALQALVYGLMIHPDDGDLVLTRATWMREMGEGAEAYQLAGECVTADPRERDLFFIEDCVMRGSITQANELISKANVSEDEDPNNVAFDYGEIFFSYGYYTEALRWLELISYGEAERQLDVLKMRGECYSKLCFYDKALREYTLATELDAYDVNAWTLQAETFLKMGRKDDALNSIDYALAINPVHPAALRLKLICFDDNQQALDFIERFDYASLCVDPSLVNIIADVYFKARMYEQAEEFYSTTLFHYPPHAAERLVPLRGLAHSRLMSGKTEEALALYHIINIDDMPVIDFLCSEANSMWSSGFVYEAKQLFLLALLQAGGDASHTLTFMHSLYPLEGAEDFTELWRRLYTIGLPPTLSDADTRLVEKVEELTGVTFTYKH